MTLAPRAKKASPRIRKGDKTRTAILEAAERLISEHGYQSTSLQAVAAAVGITQQGVLYHFPSKEALLIGVLAEYQAAGSSPTENGLEVLDELQKVFRESLNDKQVLRFLAVVTGEGLTEDHPAQLFVRNRYEDVLDDLSARLKQGQQNGTIRDDIDPEQVVSVLTAAMDGMSVQWLLNPEANVAASFEWFTDLLHHALAKSDSTGAGRASE